MALATQAAGSSKLSPRKPSRTIRIRQRELASRLQRIPSHPQPKAALEQYAISSDLAARILFDACYAHDEIEGKTVVDFGTGTGRLAVGAALLGASYVIGVDIDGPSLQIASTYSRRMALPVDWILGDISCVHGPVDTVLMNPPFGTKQLHADIRFLEIVLTVGNAVYTIHKSTTRTFLTKWLEARSRKAEIIAQSRVEIPHQFAFHRKRRYFVDVDVFRVVTR